MTEIKIITIIDIFQSLTFIINLVYEKNRYLKLGEFEWIYLD